MNPPIVSNAATVVETGSAFMTASNGQLSQSKPQLCFDLFGLRERAGVPIGWTCVFALSLMFSSVCRAQDPVQVWFPLNEGDVRNFQFAGQSLQEQVAMSGSAGTRRIFSITEGGTVARLSTGDGVLRLESLTDSGFLIEFRPGLQILTAATALRGGSLISSSQLLVGGSLIPGGVVSLTSTIGLIGGVTVPAGDFVDCRELKWDLRVSVPGRTAALITQAFILAPQVGPVREAAIDANQNFLGWWDLVSGTVGGLDVRTLTNRISPSFSEQPTNETALVGQTLALSAVATGNPAPTYQWQRKPVSLSVWSNVVDSEVFVGAASPQLVLPNTTTNLSGHQFRCVASNALGSVTSRVASVTILALPSLIQQPTNLTVIVGKAASFSVTAAGTPPLSYQWSKGGVKIAGATSKTFSIAVTKATDAADYSVAVTNVAGRITSSNATLTVLVPPTITQAPTNLTVILGQSALFTVTATANAPLSYQWLKGTVPIPGATGASYLIPSAQVTDAAGYSVVVTNVAGKATSTSVTLKVLVPPQLTRQPTNLIVNLGKTASFSVLATGTAPLSYQWLKGGIRITGATSQTFSIAAVKATDVADYSVTVTNLAGSVSSTNASLTVIFPPTLTQAPTNLTVVVGESATFNVTATANAPLSYQWRKGTANILGATGSVYTLPVTKTTDAGSYTVVVSDRAGSVTSTAAVLTVKPAVLPVITQQPTNQIVPLGQSATFVVAVNSRPSPTYQWSKNKVALSGATNAGFTLHGVSASDAGSYTVLVKNSAGGVLSEAAELVVGPPMPLEFISSGSLLPDGSFQIQWIGGQGMITVEASDDLMDWQPVAHEEAAPGFSTYADPDARVASQRFYRLRSER
ncbi:MAG: immunoglobulin domain-containing protein [Verrucomicrobiales bacterium]|nr:immunoglobulin domain-containing protein [Verrucomicrobiales bacterium]